MRKTALLLLLSAYGTFAWAQQSQKVRGKVLDADNKPVAVATVNIKGVTGEQKPMRMVRLRLMLRKEKP